MLYTVEKSMRAKRIRITIKPDASVVVTLPYKLSTSRAESFVNEKRNWIEKKVTHIQKRIEEFPQNFIPKNNKKDFETLQQKALTLVQQRLLHFNTHYDYTWKNVAVKNITSRWGSCSRRGNLSFSYRILFLTPEVADYLVVHELCHLGEFNHSKKFWTLVEQTLPHYKELRLQLKGII